MTATYGMADEEKFVRAQDNQWCQGHNRGCGLLRNKWQHWWFRGRVCIHNIRAEWSVILKIIVALLIAGLGKFVNIIFEF
jgi:hypothetical protein